MSKKNNFENEKDHHLEHNHSQHSSMDHSMHMGNLKIKFFISLILTIPIIFLSPMMGLNLPFQFTFNGSQWVVLILATILFFYGGMPFLKGAKMELQMKKPCNDDLNFPRYYRFIYIQFVRLHFK